MTTITEAPLITPKETTAPQYNRQSIDLAISGSWSRIAPFWPLKNLIAVNPLAGFEHLPFHEALVQGTAYFQQQDMPAGMQLVNRESIKWLQAFFDQGQASISMPLRTRGLLKSTLQLFRFDQRLHKNDPDKIRFLENLPHTPRAVIAESLFYLGISEADQETFLTLVLTTLPGWAAHVQYRTSWADAADEQDPHPVTKAQYLAFRLVLTCLLWPGAADLLRWHRNKSAQQSEPAILPSIIQNERNYQQQLVKQVQAVQAPISKSQPAAQLVFCIDVRSEPFRRALETQGHYETYGFAGFFGLPVTIQNPVTDQSYASCPVLLKPAYTVQELPGASVEASRKAHKNLQGFKKLYQSLKYNFTTPFSLVEIMGWASGAWMGIRTLFPKTASTLQTGIQQAIAPAYPLQPVLDSIPLPQQVAFGAGALKMMGLTQDFAPLVIFCGHGSATENNAYATALDCGACGGRHGAPNARILAAILNSENVRKELEQQDLFIPADTLFLAGEHITTTDEVLLFPDSVPPALAAPLQTLQQDLEKARKLNSLWRSREMGLPATLQNAAALTELRAKDWAEVRPEWGLAGNAAFIVAPRWLTKDINLAGRSFLHSYEWEKDRDGAALTTILTAPMVVAQWINAQYFFSTLDNTAFGAGSKVTKNITGKIGSMQGNASDLMHGLPLQSVYRSDSSPYHSLQRLTVLVHAPKTNIERIIQAQEILQRLFGNAWVHLLCYDPTDQQFYQLSQDLIFTPYKY